MGRPKTQHTAWHYGLRFTLPDNGLSHTQIVEKLFEVVYNKEPVQRELFERTIGVENGWETGKPHIHFHFKSFHTDSNFRKTIIKNFMKEIGDNRKCDNAVYSLKKLSSEDIEDINRFYRYPLKECGLKYKEFCKFPDSWVDDNCPEIMARLAKDEMENKLRDIAKTEAHEAKKEAKKNEIIVLMDEIHSKTPFTNTRSILKELIKYYAEERESIDLRHATNKAIYFELRYGLTDLDTLTDKALSMYR